MVRNKERKFGKENFCEDRMCEAIQLVEQGKGLRMAAKDKGLKYTCTILLWDSRLSYHGIGYIMGLIIPQFLSYKFV